MNISVMSNWAHLGSLRSSCAPCAAASTSPGSLQRSVRAQRRRARSAHAHERSLDAMHELQQHLALNPRFAVQLGQSRGRQREQQRARLAHAAARGAQLVLELVRSGGSGHAGGSSGNGGESCT